jgi:NitT/TauT family transport system substrate-binding protein
VSRDFLTRHSETVKKLLQSHVEVTQIINSNKNLAVDILNKQILADTSKALARPVITNALQRVDLTWDPAATSLFKDAQAAYDIHFLTQKPNLKGIYDLRLLNDVLREKGLPAIIVPPVK